MDKTSQNVPKDPKRVEAARKDRENYMNKLKENILNDGKKGGRDSSNASNETTSPTNTIITPAPALPAPPPQDPVILMSMALVYLLSLPLEFAYFLHIKLRRLQTKNKSLKNKHQNDVICFRPDDEKTLYDK